MKTTLAGLLVLGTLVSCGGGGGGSQPNPSNKATSLSFASTATASEYRFLKNTGLSNSTRLVLDLYGPSGETARGLALFMTADTAKVSWVNPVSGSTTGSFVSVGSVFDLQAAPQLLKDRLSGTDLQVGIFQKGASPVAYGSSPILSVALSLNSNTTKGTVSLGAHATKASFVLNGADPAQTANISINYGTVTAE